MANTAVCTDCHYPLPDSILSAEPRVPCPACGGIRRTYRMSMGGTITPRGELPAEARDPSGEVFSERIHKSDEFTEARLMADKSEPLKLTARRSTRVPGFDEETVAVQALATAYNEKYRTAYSVRPKSKEDSGYEDRFLDSKTDEPRAIIIQVRHLDDAMIAGLGRDHLFDGSRGAEGLAEQIKKAIEKKARVDHALKPRTILLLQLPSPLGRMMRRELQRRSFDLQGFKGVWVAPFQEECFLLCSSLLETDVAVAAYYIWEADGRPDGEDQRHWFQAIEQLRGL